MKRRRHPSQSSALLRRIIPVSLVLAVVLLCGLITLNEQYRIPLVPTWDTLFSTVGLNDSGNESPQQDTLTMTVLDVGNADALLLETGGCRLLVDAGENNDGDAIVQALQQRGITKLEYVIATHPDADHIGGMDEVIRAFEIDTFLMSFMPKGYTPTTRTYENMLMAMVDKEITPTEAQYGATYPLGNATVTIVSGTRQFTETNDQSVVCRVTFGDTAFLLTGDAGTETEQAILTSGASLKADVLKVGHHGSRTSSSSAFVKAVSPTYAVITCGFSNSYGHPHSETLKTLNAVDATVLRSDLNGVITVVSDGKKVTVTTER